MENENLGMMINDGYRAAMWVTNGRAADEKRVWQIINALDLLLHPELFDNFPSVPSKKSAFIRRVARSVLADPGGVPVPELAVTVQPRSDQRKRPPNRKATDLD